MTMDMEQIFCEIDRLIETPDDWIKGEEARDENGLRVDPTSREACQFCLVGATFAVTTFHEENLNLNRETLFNKTVEAIAQEIERLHPERSEDRDISTTYVLTTYNDDPKTEHKDVRGIVDNCRLGLSGLNVVIDWIHNS